MSFFLVYNLYLLKLGHQEDFMGRVSGAMTLGSLAFTLPATRLLNRFGSKLIIQTGVACTVVTLLLRSLCEGPGLLMLLGFVNGATIAAWMVTTPVFLSQNTLPAFRSRAFSLSYGTSIGMGAVAGIAVGTASQLLSSPGKLARLFPLFSTERIILLGCCLCVLAALGVLLLLRESTHRSLTRPLATLSPEGGEGEKEILSARPLGERQGVRGLWPDFFKGLQSRRFLTRLLLVLTLWSLFVGSFSPFFNVFFYRRFRQSLQGIGIIFSLSQFCQVLAVLSMPWFLVKLGRVRAIFCMQLLAAVVLPFLLVTSGVWAAGMIYLLYLSFQVMSEPALENFIMDSVLAEERSLVSSMRYMTLFLMQALAVWASGWAIMRFGYSELLIALAAIGISASAAFYFSFRSGSSASRITEYGQTASTNHTK